MWTEKDNQQLENKIILGLGNGKNDNQFLEENHDHIWKLLPLCRKGCYTILYNSLYIAYNVSIHSVIQMLYTGN